MFKESLRMSWDNIKNNRMRSFLTALGIVIGVASIIALITVVQGVSSSMMGQFDDLGIGKISVEAYGTTLKQGVTDAEIDKLSSIESVVGVSPSVSGVSSIEKGGRVEEDVSVKGKNEVYYDNNLALIVEGRGFTPMDMSATSYVCIINETVRDELFQGDAIGNELKIGGRNYLIIGIESNSDNSLASQMTQGDSDDMAVTIPYKNALSLLGISNISSVEVFVTDTSQTNSVVANIEKILDEAFNYKEDSYFIMNMDSILEMMETMQSMLTMMLAGIASISLLVGGIGIMNMMLVSVSERTKEIGLRKALGAEPGQIQMQFIIEAILLSLLGGAIGVIMGLLISFIACILIDIAFAPSVFAIALGVGFSAAVGIVFGGAPAKRASELNPIDALRSE